MFGPVLRFQGCVAYGILQSVTRRGSKGLRKKVFDFKHVLGG